ncbi:MAG: PEP-CTERM-box response regulator transcription factor [Nitrospirae bacterium]|nr:PEP-CTERM-box response regulator transcription factor [Nitrospirota bacterium]
MKPVTPKKPLLLIVDDDETIRSQMKWALAKEYTVLEAGDRPSATETVRRERPRVVLLDLGLPPKPREADEGLQALQDILAFDSTIKVVMVTGNTERENALKAIDLGAFDFFSKPPVMDEVRVVIRRAHQMAELERENEILRRKVPGEGVGKIIGASPAMQQVFQTLRKVATVDVPVLILGESGTGKELAARAIHDLSHRRERPFVVINCGAIPENLLEGELFGHEKGAFTGADSRRRGRIEYAHGGTLFLDEVGELSLSLQVKLLRFLQDYTIERVGGREVIPVDVRVIAATNRDLQKEVNAGRYREDLFFRLGVITCTMPPLREKGDDLYLLANAFLHQYAGEFKKSIKGFQTEAIVALTDYSWPGNVRELENRIKRGVVMAEGEWLTPENLNFEPSPSPKMMKLPRRLREARDTVEKQMICEALEKHGGVILRAAEELGISRQTLTDLIKKHNISPH